MKKIYKINIDEIKKLGMMDNNYQTREYMKFRYYELFSKCKRGNGINNIILKIKNKFYQIKNNQDYNYELGNFCNNCDFKQDCEDNLNYCIIDYLFEEDTNYILKEVETYEIMFGDNNYEEDI